MAFCHHTNLVNVSQTLLHWVDSPRVFSKSVPTRIVPSLFMASDYVRYRGDYARDRWSKAWAAWRPSGKKACLQLPYHFLLGLTDSIRPSKE